MAFCTPYHTNETARYCLRSHFYIQNIGLALVPVGIGKVNQANTQANGIIDYIQTMTIFAAFGAIAIIISLLLILEDKRKGYGLQKPNIKNDTQNSLTSTVPYTTVVIILSAIHGTRLMYGRYF